MKRTLIIGASANYSRYSYLAARKLTASGHPVLLLGRRKGFITDQEIHVEPIVWDDVDTVTLYINPSIQPSYYDYIISLKPKRVIFNPGTENPDFHRRGDIKHVFSHATALRSIVLTSRTWTV